MSWSVSNTAFVMIPRGYNCKNIQDKGFSVYNPYKDKTVAGRIVREICFHFPFFKEQWWYNPDIIDANPKYIIIYDPLITKDYLTWLHQKLPDTQLNFLYNNMIGKANHLYPQQIPAFVRIWTYDDYDAKRFNIPIYPYCITSPIITNNRNPEYDVLFVGRDKGRGEWLVNLEKELQSMGLKTKFIITKTKRYSRKKPFHQNEISYDTVLDYVSKSRAILNVTMDNQEGVTLRDIEAITYNIKLITTNKNITNKDFYNPNNVFIIGTEDISKLPAFLKSNPEPISSELILNHSFENKMNAITSDTYALKGIQ